MPEPPRINDSGKTSFEFNTGQQLSAISVLGHPSLTVYWPYYMPPVPTSTPYQSLSASSCGLLGRVFTPTPFHQSLSPTISCSRSRTATLSLDHPHHSRLNPSIHTADTTTKHPLSISSFP